MTRITIMGANGFLGSHLKKRLNELGHDVFCPDRGKEISRQTNLGHVIYSIGLTADFRSRPFDTVWAHVCKLTEVLKQCEMESLLYLSSTRLYGRSEHSTVEESNLLLNPLDPSDLYNISKAMGESICLSSSRKTRIARLSNVYGKGSSPDNFLAQIIRESMKSKKLLLHTALESEKDYIHVDEAIDLLIGIMLGGREKIYNVASGFNTSHAEISKRLTNITGCKVEVAGDAPIVRFPEISTERIDREFSQYRKNEKVIDKMNVLAEGSI